MVNEGSPPSWGSRWPAALLQPCFNRPPRGPPLRLSAQVIDAELEYKLACSGYDVRAFVSEALESMNLGAGLAAARAELMAALDEAERASGGSLSADNDKGWQVGRGRRPGRIGSHGWLEQR